MYKDLRGHLFQMARKMKQATDRIFNPQHTLRIGLRKGHCQEVCALTHAYSRLLQAVSSSICRLVSRSGRRWSEPNVSDGGRLSLGDARTGGAL